MHVAGSTCSLQGNGCKHASGVEHAHDATCRSTFKSPMPWPRLASGRVFLLQRPQPSLVPHSGGGDRTWLRRLPEASSEAGTPKVSGRRAREAAAAVAVANALKLRFSCKEINVEIKSFWMACV